MLIATNDTAGRVSASGRTRAGCDGIQGGGPPAEPAPAATESAAAAKPAGKIPSGYRRVTRNGKELYCRSVITLGSRFAEQMCFTREQLEDIAARTIRR